MIINVDTAKLATLVQQGDDIVLTANGEDALVALLDLQQLVEAAIAAVKDNIKVAALAYNPNFTKIKTDRVNIRYGVAGGQSKYKLDLNKLNVVPQELYTQVVRYSLDSKAVDKYLKEHGKLPDGITLVERTKTLSIKKSISKKADNDI